MLSVLTGSANRGRVWTTGFAGFAAGFEPAGFVLGALGLLASILLGIALMTVVREFAIWDQLEPPSRSISLKIVLRRSGIFWLIRLSSQKAKDFANFFLALRPVIKLPLGSLASAVRGCPRLSGSFPMKTEKKTLVDCHSRTRNAPEKKVLMRRGTKLGVSRRVLGCADDLEKFQNSLAKYKAKSHAVWRKARGYSTGSIPATITLLVIPVAIIGGSAFWMCAVVWGTGCMRLSAFVKPRWATGTGTRS